MELDCWHDQQMLLGDVEGKNVLPPYLLVTALALLLQMLSQPPAWQPPQS